MRDWRLLGASYVAAFVGDPDIRITPIDVYLAMTGQKPLQDLSKVKRVQWGKRNEEAIIKSFEEDHNVQMERQVTFYSPLNELYCCTPDAIDKSGNNGKETWLEKGVCLEVKNVASDKGWRYANGVPKAEFCQIQWQGKCINDYLLSIDKTPLIELTLRALFGGNEDLDYYVPVDPIFIGNLTEAADDFVSSYVEKKQEPPPDCTEAYSDFLFRKFPEADIPKDKKKKPELLEISDDSPDYKLIEKYFDINLNIKKLDRQLTGFENEIKTILGPRYGLASPLGKILWGNMKGSAKWKAIAEYMFDKHKISEKEKNEIIKNNTGDSTRFFRSYPKK